MSGERENPGTAAEAPAPDREEREVTEPFLSREAADTGEGTTGQAPAPGEGTDEPADEVSALRAMLEDSANRARQTSDRLRELHERHLRLAAEFENFKKRASREKDETVKLGNERLIRDLLPVVDNLERAIASADVGDAKTLLEGVKLVARQFVETLGRFGAQPFESVGQPFDPNRHEALMQQEADLPPNTVVSEMAKGYFLHDRLLRPAMVVVSRPPQEQPAPAGEPAAPREPETGPPDA